MTTRVSVYAASLLLALATNAHAEFICDQPYKAACEIAESVVASIPSHELAIGETINEVMPLGKSVVVNLRMSFTEHELNEALSRKQVSMRQYKTVLEAEYQARHCSIPAMRELFENGGSSIIVLSYADKSSLALINVNEC